MHYDYARMREIADKSNAYLLSDMAHISGLVAAGELQLLALLPCIAQRAPVDHVSTVSAYPDTCASWTTATESDLCCRHLRMVSCSASANTRGCASASALLVAVRFWLSCRAAS